MKSQYRGGNQEGNPILPMKDEFSGLPNKAIA